VNDVFWPGTQKYSAQQQGHSQVAGKRTVLICYRSYTSCL